MCSLNPIGETLMTSSRCERKYSREDIRSARRADLPSLLRREGHPLRETGAGNFELLCRPGLIVKRSFWRWPGQNRQGNAIDLFVNVLGMSFDQAMSIITQSKGDPHEHRLLPE
jgi:hypothetical protein